MCDETNVMELMISIVYNTSAKVLASPQKERKHVTMIQVHFGSLLSHADECHQLPEPPCYQLQWNLGSIGDFCEAGRSDELAHVSLLRVAEVPMKVETVCYSHRQSLGLLAPAL